MAGIYHNDIPYDQVLNTVHERLKMKMMRNTAKREALELQTILTNLKIAAKDFNNTSDSPTGVRMATEFDELIQTAFSLQSQHHGSNFLASTLFRRGHKTKTIAEADNIFEEDLAAILAAGEILGGNENITIQQFLFGTQSTGTKATQSYSKQLNILDDENVSLLLQKLAEKEQKRASTQVQNATGKIDISGKAITLSYEKQLPPQVERLMYLMKDATISAKSYSSKSWDINNKKDWSEIGLHLGNTNLYKAVTGALSEVQMGHKQATSFFFRGINTILHNSHGNANLTATHFSHLRFIFELRGSGLLDESGLVLPVKYLIYNDPSSDVIYVKDTASIILEALESATRSSNLLGDISLSASKVKT